MNDILYIYDDEQNMYRPFDVLDQFGSVRQICKGFSPNSFQILSETGCLYYISFELSFYQLPFKSEKIKLITTNKSVTLALSYSGNIYSFGEDQNKYGTLGIAKIYFVPIPSRIGTDFKQISLSSHIACALDYSGKLWTWGQTPVGNFEIPSIVNPMTIKVNKLCAGRDFILLIDGSSNIFLLSDSFRSSFYSTSKWVVQKFRQLSNEHLVITEILPNEHYSFALTNKNDLYLLANNDLVVKKLDIRIKIHNITQNETHLYCLTELSQFIKIDKASLYQNEQIEMKSIYEQIRYEPVEKALISSIAPMNIIKNTHNQVQGFIIDRKRFCDGSFKLQQSYTTPHESHKQETQLKISIISHSINQTPSKTTLPQKSRIYYSPQPIIIKSSKSTVFTPLKQSAAVLPKTYLSRTPNMQTPLARSFVKYSESRIKSPVKKANLMRLLVQDVQQTINQSFRYPQIAFEFRERISSNRSNSAQDVRQMIKEINPRANSSEKEKIQEFVHKERSYDQVLNQQMRTVRVQLQGLKQNQQEEYSEEGQKLDELSVGEFGTQDKEGKWVQSRIIGGKSQTIPSNRSPNLQSPLIRQFEETNTFFEEEILIRNKQKQDRILVREIIENEDDQKYVNDENLYSLRGKNQILIASRVITDIIDSSWEQIKNKYQKVISKEEPIQYLEEDINQIQELDIVKKQIRRLPEMLTIGENINELLQNGDFVESRRLVENNESFTQLKSDGWNIENMQFLFRIHGIEPITQIIEEELLVPAKNGKMIRKLIRRPQQMISKIEGSKVVRSRIIDATKEQELFDKVISIEPTQIVLEEVLIKKDGKLVRAFIRSDKGIDAEGKVVLSRKIIDNNQSVEGWEKINNQYMQVINEEPEEYIEEEVIELNQKTGKYDRKLIRRPANEENQALANSIVLSSKKIKNTGENKGWNTQGTSFVKNLEQSIQFVEEEVLEMKNGKMIRKLVRKPMQKGAKMGDVTEESNGARIVSRKIVDNILEEGWENGVDGQLEHIISQEEPTSYLEEEVLTFNPKLGKMEKKLVRREVDPKNDGPRQNVVKNNQSLSSLQKEGWSVFQNRFERKLSDIIEVVEEEILSYDPETNIQQRKLIRRPLRENESLEQNQQQEDNVKVLKKRIVAPNDKNNKLEWKDLGEGQMEVLLSSEQAQLVEEEILVQNAKTGKQERKLIRRPLTKQDQEYGDNLNEQGQKGQIIISRKIVNNDQTEGEWKLNSEGLMEQKVSVSEPMQYLEEEVLINNPETGEMERILVRKPYIPGQNLGTNLKEIDREGNVVVSRKVIQNNQSICQKKDWELKPNGQLVKRVTFSEPKQFIEEEIVIIKNGKQQRKLIRRPYIEGEEEDENPEDPNVKVISRKIIPNQFSSNVLQEQGWNLKDGRQELTLAQSEPIRFIEEEVLVYNKNTGYMERKLVRKPFQKNLKLGENLKEVVEDGIIILNRKVVDNLDSIQDQKQWQRNQQGNLEKIINAEEPAQFVEEEIIIVNPKTGKQERKIIRKPYLNEELDLGDDLEEVDGNMKVVARRIISNDFSTQELHKEGWNVQEDSTYEKQLSTNEPIKYVEEEILEYNEATGQMDRKLIRRQYQQKDKQNQYGDNLKENVNGKTIVGRRVVENSKSLVHNQDWQQTKEGLEKVIGQEPSLMVEEEIIVSNPKTGKQERKLIRRPYLNEEVIEGDEINEYENGVRVVSRKIVQNEQSKQQLNEKGWTEKNGQLEIVLQKNEPIKYIEEEVLEFNKETGNYQRKIIRKQFQSGSKLGEGLQEVDKDGNKIFSRKIVENIKSQNVMAKEGWQTNKKGQLEKILEEEEPEHYIEEEIIIVNPKTGKQERKLIRRPMTADDEEADVGEALNEVRQGGQKVVARRIVQNEFSNQELKEQGWKKQEDGTMQQQLSVAEPTKFIEEEVLELNPESGQLERKIIRKPYQPGAKVGESLKEIDANGNKVLARRVVENNQSTTQKREDGWEVNEQGHFQKVISQSEPEQFIEEEVIIYNPKTKKQERKLIRRPLIENEQHQLGDDLDEENEGGIKVVARRIVDNDQPLQQLQGWQQNEEGNFEFQLSSVEPTQFVEEEVLVVGQNGKVERKLVRRPITSNKVVEGVNLNETDSNGNKVVSRRIVDNNKSLNTWNQKGQQLEKVISAEEPEQFIEEEIIVINPKTGKQERKLIRRPYVNEEELGDQLNESMGLNQKVVSRKIVQNNTSLQDWKINQKTGQLEKQIIQNEPARFIEEEILALNEETGKMERKLIRKPYQPGANTGNNLQETDINGNRILSRKIVENTQSTVEVAKQGWQQNKGQFEKTLSIQEPSQYIEEEMIIENPKTGKQERKLIRRPYHNEEVEEGDQINEFNNGVRVVSRKIVQNDQSKEQLNENGWIEKNGQLEIILQKNEPIKYIEEEVLEFNEQTGNYQRKIIRKQFQSGAKLGESLQEVDKDGNKVFSRKIVDNIKSQQILTQEGWSTNKKGQLEKILEEEEPEHFIEEEIIIVNPKTGKQERKLIRRPMTVEDEEADLGETLNEVKQGGQKIVARRIVQNQSSHQELKEQGWKKQEDGTLQQQLSVAEPTKFIEEEVLQVNPETGQLERKIIRKPYQPGAKVGESLKEIDANGNKVLARRVVENNQSTTQKREEGWEVNELGQLQKVVEQEEPEHYIEEEIIIVNPKTGKQERKLIRRPMTADDEEADVGEALNEVRQGGQKVVARRIVQNEFSNQELKEQGWKKQEDGTMQQQLSVAEPTKFIEEEVLELNPESGQLERKIIRKPYQPGAKVGESLKEIDANGNKVLARRVVENNQSTTQKREDGWEVNEQGHFQKVISQSEPEQFIEEEVIIYNPKTKKQERKLIRRPLIENEQNQLGDDLDEENEGGIKVVARRIVDNDQPLQQLQGWQQNEEGNFEFQLSSVEPTQFVEEEVLVVGQNGKVERKLVRRPITSNKVVEGLNLNETDSNGNKVVSRRIVDNNKSLNTWNQKGQQLEKVISAEEPEQFIEEEIIVINPKTGKQERKLIRRPYVNEEELGDQLNESMGLNQKVVSRKIVQNNTSLQDWKINQKTGQLEKQIIQNEPARFIEEEILALNEETGKMERKLIRKPYQPGANTGNNLQETDINGNRILSRKIVENTQSTVEVAKQGWQQNKGQFEKTLSIQEPSQYIEEEIIILNPKTGKQERKLIRRPYEKEDGEEIQEGEQLLEDLGEGKYVVSRRIVDNDLSAASNKWKRNNDGGYEQSLGLEPTQFVTEEVLQYNNETGMMERKLIRKPYTGGQLKEGDQLNEQDKDGNRILSRKIEQNLQPIKIKQQEWKLNGKQEEILLNACEPEQFIEEEIIQVNAKTGKLERKIIRRPLDLEEVEALQMGDNLEEQIGNGKQVISRKIVQNQQSQQNLKKEGWIQNKDGTMEIKYQPEPVKYIEEEILVQGKDGKMERKLVRRPFLPSDNKLQVGQIIEQDNKGNKIVSRKIIQNNKSIDPTWIQTNNGILEKVISQAEPSAFIEEEIVVINPKNQRQERKLTRRPMTQEEQMEVGENLLEGDGNQKVIARRIVSNQESSESMKGWKSKQGTLEIQLAQNEPTKYVEEEILCYGQNGMQRKLVRRQIGGNENLQTGISLNEFDKDGNRILSRKIVDNLLPQSQQKLWQKLENGNLVKLIADEEPEQFVEEEIIIVNPKTGKQERRLVRRPMTAEDDQIDVGEQLNEIQNGGQKVIARRIIQNQFSTQELNDQGWKQEQDGIMYQQLSVAEPTKFIEEEILQMNPETGQLERKIIRKPFQAGAKVGESIKEVDAKGNKILARRIVENDQSSVQKKQDGWEVNEFGELQKVVTDPEPEQYVEEEIIIVNPKTGKQERKLIRRPMTVEDEEADLGETLNEVKQGGFKIVARRIVQNQSSHQELKEQGWKKQEDGTLQQQLSVAEPTKFIEEEVLQVNPETGQLERKIIRKPYQPGAKVGESLKEIDANGNKVLARRVVENNQSIIQRKVEGWEVNEHGQLQKVVEQEEPEHYIEEEIIIVNPKTGKQERKLIRRPMTADDEEADVGEALNEVRQGGQKVVARRIVQNQSSHQELKEQGWKKQEDGTLQQQLSVAEPIKFIEEEVLELNPESGQLERKIIRKPYQPGAKVGESLKEIDANGNKVLARRVVENNQSTTQKREDGWEVNEQGHFQKVISQSEPEQFIEEEVIIYNPKTKKQERKLIRRPLIENEQNQLGDDLDEENEGGIKVVARRIVDNDQPLQQLQGWQQNEEGNFEFQLSSVEPTQFVEEEVLVVGQNGKVERKLVRRPITSNNVVEGVNLNETDSNGNKVVSRRIVDNNKSLNTWNQKGQQLEKVISAEEPEQFIEEEIIVINPKTGKQERKLIRRPYVHEEELGDQLNESMGLNQKVVSRKIVQNNTSLQDWKINQKTGQLEKQIIQNEPARFIEEEILALNEETGKMERKLIRKPYQPGANTGNNLQETDINGNRILSRKIVENTQSTVEVAKQGWQQNKGQFEKTLSIQEPSQYIEEEIIIENPKTGKQERKLIRRPYHNEEVEEGDQINEYNNGVRVVSRKIVQNDQSKEQLNENGWIEKNGQLEIILQKNEPIKYIEEEVLEFNEQTGNYQRKIIRKQFQSGAKLGESLQEVDKDGNKVFSRKIVDNIKSQQILTQEGWQTNKKGQLERILEEEEPEHFIEEEIIIVNPKTGKQERKLIRRPMTVEDEEADLGETLNEVKQGGQKIVARRIVQNQSSHQELKEQGWKKQDDGTLQQQLSVAEPTKFIEEEVLQVNPETGQLERKIIRKPYQPGAKVGESLKEIDANGNKVLARRVVENNQSTTQKREEGWEVNELGQLQKVVEQEEPEHYIEEEIIIVNPKTGKQERKLIRRPMTADDEEADVGETLNEVRQGGQKVVARRIVQNEFSNQELKEQGWKKQEDGTLQQQLSVAEPIKFIEEEVLELNPESGQLERKIIRKPYQPGAKVGESLKEIDANGNKVLARRIVENNQSTTQKREDGWEVNEQGHFQKVISQSEPEQFIEEEVIIYNPKTKKQERKLIRRPLIENEQNQLGDDLDEENEGGIKVVARRIVDNDQPLQQLQGWQQNEEGNFEFQLSSVEPTQFVEEEVLVVGQNGKVERKLVRRPITSNKVVEGVNLNETDSNGNKVVSRRIVDNNKSLNTWNQKGQQLEKVISAEEPEQFIEEEIIVINPKTGKQERKLIRRPYVNEEELGDQLNESMGLNQKVVSRKIVQNNSSLQDWKINQKTGQLEKQIIQNEPARFIEEEILALNEETGKMERKLIRKPYQPGANTGNNLQETDINGNRILSRKIVENTQSTVEVAKQGWQQNKGQFEKTLSIQEPSQYIEEEIIILNPKTGKQERKLIRRPYEKEDGEEIQEGEQLLEDLGEGKYVVSRRIVDNDLSAASNKWKRNNDGGYEQSLGLEPTQFVTEEVLQYNNETGMMERKLIRKPYTGGQLKEGDQLNEQDKDGNRILSRKIEQNLQPIKIKQQEWKLNGKQEEILLNASEPEQFIEEEIIQVNAKTGKLERKIIRRPLDLEEVEALQMGDNLEEQLGNGKQVISRKIVQNQQSQQNLKKEGWIQNKDGTMEIKYQPEPVKYIEEEILVQGKDGKMERKLVRRPFLPSDNKLQVGQIIEQDNKGNKIVSRKIVQNNKSIDPTWIQTNNGILEKVISQAEPSAFIEEEIVVINPKNQRQERKLTRRPMTQEEQMEVGENLLEGDGNQKVIARRIVSNQESSESMKGWKSKQGTLEIQLAQNEPTKFVEEEILCYGQNGMQRKLVRRQIGGNENLQTGISLNEFDKDGNRILSRKIVDNLLPQSQQKLWQKLENGNLVKLIADEEPEQFVEEEIIIVNPKTGKQERRLVRRPMTAEDDQIDVGEQLNEIQNGGQKVIARRIIQNQFSTQELNDQGWKQEQDGIMYQQLSVAEPTKFIEEEILQMNPETGQLERKIIRRPLSPNSSKLKLGDNLKETDSQGNKILTRKIIENIQSQQQQKKEGWIQNAGKLMRTVSFSEPSQFIEEEIIIINPKTGKQERKVIRKPYDQSTRVECGDDLNESGQGYKVVSRKIVPNEISSEQKIKDGWVANKQGILEKILASQESSRFVEEEILSFNQETGQLERKLVRREVVDNLQLGDNIQEVDQLGNTILSRKIVENNSSQGWVKQKNGTIVKQLSEQEPEQYIEEEVVLTDKDGKQQIILERRPYAYGEDKIERKDGGFVLSRKVVQNNQTLSALQQDGWGISKNGILRKILDQPTSSSTLSQKLINQDSQYFEEEHLVMNPKTNEREIVLLKYPFNQALQIGKRLKEQDQNGDQIISRRIVTNLDLDYNPFQYVEEIVEVLNQKSQQNELFAIQKQVNITEVKIGANLNEKQANGFIIKSRTVINQFQIDNLQGWKKLTEASKDYFRQQGATFQKRSMYQIDEDSQEQRDSQYRSNEEFVSQGMKASDYDSFAKPAKVKNIEEEILIMNKQTQKFERRLQKRTIPQDQQIELGDDIYDETDEQICVSRQITEKINPTELQKKGWIEGNGNVWTRIVSKNECVKMIEEVINGNKANKQIITIYRKQDKNEELQFGDDLSEQQTDGSQLIRRTKVSNRSLAFYKNNDFIKNKEGVYVKTIQQTDNNPIKLKIPKYQEPSLKKAISLGGAQMSLIQAIEQSELTKSKSAANIDQINAATNKTQQQYINDQFNDDQGIINKTNISDISETDKMFLKQLDRKDHNKKQSSQTLTRNRVGSDKNNRSASSPFSDQEVNNAYSNSSIGIKIINRLVNKMVQQQYKFSYDQLKQLNQQYKRLAKAVKLLKNYSVRWGLVKLNEHRLQTLIEFNEADVIKYNQMLTENKIQAMEHLPEQGQQSEPVEINPDEKGSRQLVKSQSQILPKQLNFRNSFANTPQKDSNQNSATQIKSVQPVRSPQAPSTSIVMASPPTQQKARASISRKSTIKMQTSPQPQQSNKQPAQQKFFQQSEDRRKSGVNTSYSTQKSNRQQQLQQDVSINHSQNASQNSIQNPTQQLAAQQKEKISQQFKKVGSYSQKSKK